MQSGTQDEQVVHWSAPQDRPSVLRAQPAASVSVPGLALQLPLPHVYVVIGRVRDPELVQVFPYEQAVQVP